MKSKDEILKEISNGIKSYYKKYLGFEVSNQEQYEWILENMSKLHNEFKLKFKET